MWRRCGAASMVRATMYWRGSAPLRCSAASVRLLPGVSVLPDNPPDGFLRIDFDRDRPDPTFNTHIGTLYAKRGAKGTRDEFVLGFRVHQHMCNPAGGL